MAAGTPFGRKRSWVLRKHAEGGQSPRYKSKNINLFLTKYSCLSIENYKFKKAWAGMIFLCEYKR